MLLLTLQSFRDARHKKFSTGSLGKLIGELSGSYFQVAAANGADEPVEETLEQAVDNPIFRFRAGLEMSESDRARTEAELLQLRDLRNGVVHHLIEQFDIWTLEGCQAALAHLDQSYATVDAAYALLRQWVDSSRQARQHFAALLQSPQGLDIFLHGVMPDGTVDWPASTVVKLLRDAESRAEDGKWTRLEDALKTIHKNHPTHTPTRYHCKTWRQLLVRSQLFEVLKVAATETGMGSTWYCSRQSAPSH